jgi:hypothetical protein
MTVFSSVLCKGSPAMDSVLDCVWEKMNLKQWCMCYESYYEKPSTTKGLRYAQD